VYCSGFLALAAIALIAASFVAAHGHPLVAVILALEPLALAAWCATGRRRTDP
jgi:hypothetical protein